MNVADIQKSYGAESVLRGVSFALSPGDHLAVLGASGSGKTTLLRLLAGLESVDSGHVEMNGRDITHTPPEDRGVLYMPQDALLFPHLSAWENVVFPLRVHGMPAERAREQAVPLLERLDLVAHASKMPHVLSGGQRQRVAFGRAILADPSVLLLDEPFGALDHAARADMQALFLELVEETVLTTVFVTHDPGEALRLGTRWASLSEGRLHVFPNRDAFISSEHTGIPQERRFWSTL